MPIIRQLQYRATREVSKIFLKFKVYSNGQFMFYWERPNLLHSTAMNQPVCEPKENLCFLKIYDLEPLKTTKLIQFKPAGETKP